MPRTKKHGVVSQNPMMFSPGPQDKLASTVFGAIQAMHPSRKVTFLFDISLAFCSQITRICSLLQPPLIRHCQC
ncbi:hypothetical protein ARMSODRAFT_957424 [Armillaria solidipes]|uniref:Uncharacterized protein n=1 Tax=Armillaria solidipes TaxID=1076256 RepID=A0A2H3BE04_9AGAR|nr:hypothetical protein ARMSODRAFT_957424 [Armillaria solidipes]